MDSTGIMVLTTSADREVKNQIFVPRDSVAGLAVQRGFEPRSRNLRFTIPVGFAIGVAAAPAYAPYRNGEDGWRAAALKCGLVSSAVVALAGSLVRRPQWTRVPIPASP